MVSKVKTKKTEQAMRPPVVVVLGHVDHGKTTLLDYIRKTNVVARESGGITQHIGAYQVEHQGKEVTFLDTPGHAAFSAMRKRGASVADVAVLVVAADDGVKPQTTEALDAIKSAKIPYVVAFTKIDLPGADLQRTKTQLAEAGVLLEGWGGDIPNVEASGKTGKGVDELLEIVLLVAEIAELKDTSKAAFRGVVIESHKDAQRGSIATVLVKEGVLHVGDSIAAGATTGKVRAMEDFLGRPLQEAGPATPALILGLNDIPDVGDTVFVFASDEEALRAAQEEASRRRFEKVIAKGAPEARLLVILKADVTGSLEAMVQELEKLANEIVAIEIVKADTGEVTENEAEQAEATGATVFAFRVKVKPQVAQKAERAGVAVRAFSVIYELLDALKDELEKAVPPEVIRTDLGQVRVLALFRNEGSRQVVGGRVAGGIAKKGEHVEVVRADRVLGRGVLREVQQNKIPVDEVPQGRECGMLIEIKGSIDIAIGDVVRVFHEERKERKLF